MFVKYISTSTQGQKYPTPTCFNTGCRKEVDGDLWKELKQKL